MDLSKVSNPDFLRSNFQLYTGERVLNPAISQPPYAQLALPPGCHMAHCGRRALARIEQWGKKKHMGYNVEKHVDMCDFTGATIIQQDSTPSMMIFPSERVRTKQD